MGLNIFLDSLAERLVPLVASGAMDALKEPMGRIPAGAVVYFGFEVELSGCPVVPDIAVSLSPSGLAWLASGTSGWDGLSRFARLRGETVSLLFGDRNVVWLEFDFRHGAVADEPSVFFAILDPARLGTTRDRSLTWLLDEGLPTLRGRALTPPLRDRLGSLLSRLPAEVERIQLGVMARPDDVVRLCLFRFVPSALPDALAAVHWPGPYETVRKIIARQLGYADRVAVQIDVGASILPSLGIELLYDAEDPWDRQPPREPRWKSLLDMLVEDGLCRPGLPDALLAWPERRSFVPPLIERLLGVTDCAAAPWLSGVEEGILVTGLQHVKLSLRPDRLPSAKIYFGARHLAGAVG